MRRKAAFTVGVVTLALGFGIAVQASAGPSDPPSCFGQSAAAFATSAPQALGTFASESAACFKETGAHDCGRPPDCPSDEHGRVVGARLWPKRAMAVAVFDKVVAFPSLLAHPNLTIEVLLLREDHIRCPQPAIARGRTRDPGERRLVEVLDGIALRTPEDVLAALPVLPLRAVQHTRARRLFRLQHGGGPAHGLLPTVDRDRRARA